MLRTRLFLNLTPFVVILLAFGLYAIVLFSQETAQLDASVTGNYRAVVAAQKMKLSLNRMEDGVLQAMQENKALGTAIFEKSRKEFEDNLDQLLPDGKTPQEGDLNRRLGARYQSFAEAGSAILRLDDPAAQQQAFKEKLEAGLPAIDKLLDQIHMLNDAAILATTQNVETVKWNVTQLMIIGVGCALVIAGYAGIKLARSVLVPIQSLTRATQELGEGKPDQLVTATSQDEP